MLDNRQEVDKDWYANAKQHLEDPNLCLEVKQMFILNSAIYCLRKSQVRQYNNTAYWVSIYNNTQILLYVFICLFINTYFIYYLMWQYTLRGWFFAHTKK